MEYELLEMPLDEEKHPVDILRDQTDHFLDNFHFSGILPYRVCPDFVNEYAELGRSFGYLTERSVLFIVENNDECKKELRGVLEKFLVDVHVINPPNSDDEF